MLKLFFSFRGQELSVLLSEISDFVIEVLVLDLTYRAVREDWKMLRLEDIEWLCGYYWGYLPRNATKLK